MQNQTLIFGIRLKQLRKEFGWTQGDLSEKLGIVRSAVSNYETNRTMPDPNTLNQLAKLFNVSVDYLLGRTNSRELVDFNPILTKKDEKNIAKKLEEIIDVINTQSDLTVDANSLDDDTKELLIASIERTLRQAKLSAKEKFTPKKYRK